MTISHLTILHTNDLHGHLGPLSRVATLARQIRTDVARRGGACVLWDAGDAEDTALYESSMTKGSAMMGILRAAGFELETLGNASVIRYGQHVVPNLAEHFGRPLLCANLFEAATGRLIEGVVPYVVQSLGELTVGVIGLTDPNRFYRTFFGMDVHLAVDLLPGLIHAVRQAGAHIVILLSHLGGKSDQEVAAAVAGLDVIVGGHSHEELYPPCVVNNTLIVQAGAFGKFLGRLDLTIELPAGRIVASDGELIPVGEEIALDPATEAGIAIERARVQAIAARKVGALSQPLTIASDRECAAGNALADALLTRVPGAQAALVLSGHWTAGLDAGPLTFGQLNDVLRSTANPGRVVLTGAEIKQFLSAALQPGAALRQLRELRGTPVGWPHVAGLTARFDLVQANRLEVWIGERPLDERQTYVVATTDMELADFIGYLTIPDDRVTYEVPTIMPEVMEDYLALHWPLIVPPNGRLQPR